jgi:hypothetical protein
LIIGKVTKVNESDDQNDGYLSTVELSVQKSFSKGVKVNDVLELRRISGETAAGRVTSSVEETLVVGDAILLVGSKAYYSNGKTAGQDKNIVVELLPFYRVNGERLVPSSPYQQATTIGEISAQ